MNALQHNYRRLPENKIDLPVSFFGFSVEYTSTSQTGSVVLLVCFRDDCEVFDVLWLCVSNVKVADFKLGLPSCSVFIVSCVVFVSTLVIFVVSLPALSKHSRSKYGLETQLKSLFYLFVRLYAILCTVHGH